MKIINSSMGATLKGLFQGTSARIYSMHLHKHRSHYICVIVTLVIVFLMIFTDYKAASGAIIRLCSFELCSAYGHLR